MNRFYLWQLAPIALLVACAVEPVESERVGEVALAASDCVSVCAEACLDETCVEQCAAHCGVTPCGPTFCDLDEVCCNASCGICTPPGGACTLQYCGPILPLDAQLR